MILMQVSVAVNKFSYLAICSEVLSTALNGMPLCTEWKNFRENSVCKWFISESELVLNFEPFGDVMSGQKDDRGQHTMLYNIPF